MKKSFIKRNTKNAGFTLVETLVAIAILMIAIAGPLTVAEKGLSAAIYARDHLIGSYLAQDGMESIKNIVDTNQIYIGSTPNSDLGERWFVAKESSGSNIDLTGCTFSSPCSIDTTGNVVIVNWCITINNNPCDPLYLGSGGYTMDNTNPATPFTRYFYVQPFSLGGNANGGANNAANIVMTVTWPGDVVGGGGVILEDTMFDTPLQ
jgi:prepilin-type N-terminal cleavage/methylation domain-containing protein